MQFPVLFPLRRFFPVVSMVASLGASLPLMAVPLVISSDDWRYRKGTSAPQANWQSVTDAALDASWLTGPGGFGYGDGDDATELLDMEGASGYRTVYIRQEFTVPAGELTPTDEVILRIDYDDGFVAYLDGVEVARANAPGSVGTEPGHTDGPSETHEADGWEEFELGLVSDLLGEGTHILAILGMNESLGSSDFSLIADLETRTPPPPPPPLHWTLADSPIILTETFDVLAGQTLTIDAGVEVRCPSGTDAIECFGVVLANGTQANPIRFVPSTPGGTWGRIELRGPEESRFTHCDFERAATSGYIYGNGTRVYLDHCRFIDVDDQMVDLVDSSCIIQYCSFDSIVGDELLHFSRMPSDGYALIAYCRFGIPGVPATSGYNDIIDFTGGNRPGPIPRLIGNVFLSGVDDCFDMDGTDAHIEGNVFFNVRKDSDRASSSHPITTGRSGGNDSELVIVRNVFVNCEHNLLIKDHGTVLMQNNTTLTILPNPLSDNTSAAGDEAPGIVLFGEPWRGDPFGDGIYYQGNIAADLQVPDPWPLLAEANAATGCFLRTDFNCVEGFAQTGEGNIAVDPMFVDRSGIDATNVYQKLALQPGSPCIGTGPNGLDMGALVPAGASISGEPSSPTAFDSATLMVAGPGIWSYRWRLNGGPWSDEVSLVPQSIWDGGQLTDTMFDNAPPIELTGLDDGTYTVEVQGRNSAGDWQETPTLSKTWTVASDPGDSDGDGMPDSYETANGLNPNDPGDAAGDLDGDGSSNLEEFVAGTDPGDAASVLVLRRVEVEGDDIVVEFDSVAGKSYQLQANSGLDPAGWIAVETLPSTAGGAEVLTVPNGATAAIGRRFFRVVTPAPAPRQ